MTSRRRELFSRQWELLRRYTRMRPNRTFLFFKKNMRHIFVYTMLFTLTILTATLIAACGGDDSGSSDFGKSCLMTRSFTSTCGSGTPARDNCADLNSGGGGLVDGLSFATWCNNFRGRSSTTCTESNSCCGQATNSNVRVAAGTCRDHGFP